MSVARARRAIGWAVTAVLVVGASEASAADKDRRDLQFPDFGLFGMLFGAGTRDPPSRPPTTSTSTITLPPLYLPYPAGDSYPFGRGPGGYGNLVSTESYHTSPTDRFGVDLLMPRGSTVAASAAGIASVETGCVASDLKCGVGLGNFVIVTYPTNPPTRSRYGHNSKVLVAEGAVVGQGDLLALTGNTGNALSRNPGDKEAHYIEGKGFHLHNDTQAYLWNPKKKINEWVGVPFDYVETGRPKRTKTAEGDKVPVSRNVRPAPRSGRDDHAPFLPPPGGGEGGAFDVSSSNSTATTSDLGGVDLSRVTLRYLGLPKDGPLNGISYVMRAPRGKPTAGVAAGDVVDSASNSFFVWLALRPDAFTANLNPSEPDRIMDAQLAKTEPGRVILEADLEMKRTVARLIQPDTRTGAAIWRKIGAAKGASGACFSFRQWITPATATIYSSTEAVYIADAPLRVQLENEYLQGGGGRQGCGREQDANVKAVEAAYRRLVLPRVERAVNTAREYASLRRVYHSRVAAEWYRRRSAAGPYDEIVDSGSIAAWRDTVSWKPRDVFDRYLRSLRKGEFNVRRRERSGNGIAIHTYTYGGVDFSRIRMRSLKPALLAVHRSGIPVQLLSAIIGIPTIDGAGAWFGAAARALRPKTAVARAEPAGDQRAQTSGGGGDPPPSGGGDGEDPDGDGPVCEETDADDESCDEPEEGGAVLGVLGLVVAGVALLAGAIFVGAQVVRRRRSSDTRSSWLDDPPTDDDPDDDGWR